MWLELEVPGKPRKLGNKEIKFWKKANYFFIVTMENIHGCVHGTI